jgi:phenylpropionate dioxygenase-like ring-hydroxylating dioxygenase large terminal subunit
MVATSATERDGLANEAYTGGAYLEQQRQSVLLSTWQFAGRVSQLQNVGDVVSTKVASSPVLLLRDEKSVIRAVR